METYTVKNLSFRYPETGIDVLKNITFSINEGEFITVCGPSGCGKSTLLRHLKPDLSPHGVLSGEIFFEKKPISDLSHREQSSKIGFVMQSPENQIVTDKVWHELAFGLESLGYKIKSADLTRIPSNSNEITDAATAKKIVLLLEKLDEHDDVQNVYSNFEASDEIMNSLDV